MKVCCKCTAKDIVEAEIGPQDDMDKFVQQALPVDFFLTRLQLENVSGPGQSYKKKVVDADTGIPLCIIQSLLGQDGSIREWNIQVGDTLSLMRLELKHDPGFGSVEIDYLSRCYFSSWHAAIAHFLTFGATQSYIKAKMGFDLALENINAFHYERKLSFLRESLIEQDFLVQRIGRRTGTSCYVTGLCDSLDATEVLAKLKAACIQNWTCAIDTTAALRNEQGLWQLDFKLPSLFESEDMDDFVSTSFRNQVPGYKEMERIEAYRDALRRHGLPIYKIFVQYLTPPLMEYVVYWDNRVTNYSKSKVVRMIGDVITELKIDLKTYDIFISGKGSSRSARIRLDGIEPLDPRNSFTVESQEDEFAEFAEVAASKAGTIGDELRLGRLVKFLKSYGVKIGGATLRQKPDFGINPVRTYFTVVYELVPVSWEVEPPFDRQVVARLQSIIMRFLRRDYHVTDQLPPPETAVKCNWSGTVARVTIHVESLRRFDDSLKDTPLEWANRALTPEELGEGMEDEIGDIASTGLKARMLLVDLKKDMERRGYTVRNVLGYHNRSRRIGVDMMVVYAHINAYSYDPDKFVHFDKAKVLADWSDATQALSGTNRSIVPDTEDGPQVWTLRAVVTCPEPHVTWDGFISVKESIISTDDMGIGEHERLAAILRETQRFADEKQEGTRRYSPLHILWAKAEPMDESLGWPPGSVCVTVRAMGSEPYIGYHCFSQALTVPGERDIASSTGQQGVGARRSIGRDIMDFYAILKPADVTPLRKTLKIKGPTYNRYLNWSTDGEIDESEEFDPESEAWVQKSVNNFSGYRDMERLKQVARDIQAAGFDLIGISQTPREERQLRIANGNSLVNVLIAVSVTSERRGTSGIDSDYKRMLKVFENDLWGHDVLDFTFQYDTTGGTERVFGFKWLAFDIPEDIPPYLSLRYGEWNEWAEVFHDHLATMFLVEHYSDHDAPVDEPEEDPEMLAFFSGAEDQANPMWRERLRLGIIANELKKLGYGGTLYLQGYESIVNRSSLHINLSSNLVGSHCYDLKAPIIWQVLAKVLVPQKVITRRELESVSKEWNNPVNRGEPQVDKDSDPRNLVWMACTAIVPYTRLPETQSNMKPSTSGEPRVPASKTQIHVRIGESFDPEEIVQGADASSIFGVYSALRQIAARLAKYGWEGFIHVEPKFRRLAQYRHRFFLVATLANPNEDPHKPPMGVVEYALEDFEHDSPLYGGGSLKMSAHGEGYTDAMSWTASTTLSLPGTIPTGAVIQCDVKSGQCNTITEGVTENMDPDELVQQSNQSSVYGAHQALSDIAQQLSAAGMIGYIYCKPIYVGNGTASLTIRMIHGSGAFILHSHTLVRNLMDKVLAPFPGHSTRHTRYTGFPLKGYTAKDAVEQNHWCIGATVVLPGIFQDTHPIQVDIATGTTQSLDDLIGWDWV